MEVHAVHQPRKTRLTGCHPAPFPPLPHPVLHSFNLGTLPAWLHGPTVRRPCLGLLYSPLCTLCPRVSPLRRLLVGLLRPRGNSCECLRDQLANVSLTPWCRLCGSPAFRGFPSVRVQSWRGRVLAASCVACAACTSAVITPMGGASCTPCAGSGRPGTGMGPPGTAGGAPCGMAGSGAGVACVGGSVAVGPARGTARASSVVCASGIQTDVFPPAALWGPRCVSPSDSPGCLTPRPGAGTDGGADVAWAPRAATVGSPACAAGGIVTASCGA